METVRRVDSAVKAPIGAAAPTRVELVRPSRPTSDQLWNPLLDCIALTLLGFCTFVLVAILMGATSARTLSYVFLGDALRDSFLLSIIQVLFCKAYGLYITAPVISLVEETGAIVKATVLSNCALMAWFYLSQKPVEKAHGLFVWAVVSSGWLLVSRQIRSTQVERGIAQGVMVRNALIVGAGEVGQSLAYLLKTNPKLGFSFQGFLDNSSKSTEVIGPLASLHRVVRTRFIDQIFVTGHADREFVKSLTLEAPRLRVDVSIVPDTLDGIGWNAPIAKLGNVPLLILHRSQVHSFQLFLKRIIDIVGASAMLLILSPFMIVIAAAIKMTSHGPILYRAPRVGKKGVIFNCFKFRSMEVDADKRLDDLAHLNERVGLLFKLKNDPRVTSLGRFLRQYSLDELPQLFNVIRGEMSLIGPRPPAINEYEHYHFEHLRKLQVTPGITGLWQVSARSDPSFESYIRYDLEYIENWSLWLDFVILLRTIPVVLKATGV